jgi:hypothetical protein
MDSSRSSIFRLFAVAGLVLLLILPSMVEADGGPILTDPELWVMIDEGQQIAVVELQQDGMAQIDLFISMADRSGQSHEVTFFLPLGVQAGAFGVVEETSLAFDEALTEHIESQLKAGMRGEALYRAGVQASLLLGSLVTNGAWLVALPLLLSSCAGEGLAPVATFETPSSQVAIYDMNAEMDLQALIETTGLDPKVRETLAALQGQQIAVVRLQTQPIGAEEEPSYLTGLTGQPGIHLSWRSTLVSHSAGATYSYPLGTGRAWANPIELTRVYVVSPPELDFRVEYPRLGADLSGIWETGYSGLIQQAHWRIDDAKDPAFAVDEAYGDFGHIWRATYIKSNSGQDLAIRLLPDLSPEMQRAVRSSEMRGVILSLTWLISLLVGVSAWVVAWRVIMPRRLGVPYRWRGWKLYGDAVAWAFVYPIMNGVVLVAVGLICGVSYLILGSAWPAVVVGLPLMLVVLGLGNAFFYALWQAKNLQIKHGRAFGAYMLVVLMANILYLAFAASYGAIVGAI